MPTYGSSLHKQLARTATMQAPAHGPLWAKCNRHAKESICERPLRSKVQVVVGPETPGVTDKMRMGRRRSDWDGWHDTSQRAVAAWAGTERHHADTTRRHVEGPVQRFGVVGQARIRRRVSVRRRLVKSRSITADQLWEAQPSVQE
jgi:hypothetical protein